MRDDLENPMAVGEYYQQERFYAACDECGRPIYEGESFHLIRKKDGYHKMQFCSDCHHRMVADCNQKE